MKIALFFWLAVIFGAIDGFIFAWLRFREQLRLMEEDRDYWFHEHEWLAKSVSRRLDRREHDDADWWKEQA